MLNRHLERLFPYQPSELHRRASRWHEQNGYIPAIRHALMAGDQDRAIQLIEQNGVLLLIRGEIITLLKWIEAVEPHSRLIRGYLSSKPGRLSQGQLDRVDEMLRTAELISRLERTQDVRTMQGTIAARRAFQANMQGEAQMSTEFARQALVCLPDIDLVSRSLRTVATSLLETQAR
jgi:ATP/maltotriose-dependent transcriptional regulator MalT